MKDSLLYFSASPHGAYIRQDADVHTGILKSPLLTSSCRVQTAYPRKRAGPDRPNPRSRCGRCGTWLPTSQEIVSCLVLKHRAAFCSLPTFHDRGREGLREGMAGTYAECVEDRGGRFDLLVVDSLVQVDADRAHALDLQRVGLEDRVVLRAGASGPASAGAQRPPEFVLAANGDGGLIAARRWSERGGRWEGSGWVLGSNS